jgi:hypothetical protein
MRTKKGVIVNFKEYVLNQMKYDTYIYKCLLN